jgi:hypothetical protein
MKTTAIWTTALVALVGVSPLRAHHSSSMFDETRPTWVKGTVVRYERINPHVMFTLEQRQEDGQVRQWIVEGASLLRHEQRGIPEDVLKVGDVIEVCGFPFKEEVRARFSPAAAPGVARPALHGKLLVLPDGHLRIWGPYGALGNCIRPSDDAQQWVDALDADQWGRETWCGGRGFTIAPAASRTLVDDVNIRMATRCE